MLQARARAVVLKSPTSYRENRSLFAKKWQAQFGVEKETFLNYFQGAAPTYGILIARTWEFESANGLKVRRRKGGIHPPQSYRYVGSEELVKLMD